MDKQHIIEEIKRTAKENGGEPLGRHRFRTQTGIRESDWIGRYWTKWSDAVREAGYAPRKWKGSYDNDWLLEQFASLVRELGHFPVSAELRMKARSDDRFPSHNTFRRFGRKAQLAGTLVGWCEGRSDWNDVRDISMPLVEMEDIEPELNPEGEPVVGYVYLLKSGRYYKIGHSKSPGRREYELSIQLPDPVKAVHKIKTDDPSGIEAYWHRRFADRRKNGEWFELKKTDVSAFRRRKFM